MIIITSKLFEIYKFCIGYVVEFHRFPTITEVGYAFGFTRERARQVFVKLEKAKLIQHIEGRHRGYAINVAFLENPKRDWVDAIKRHNKRIRSAII